MLDPGRYFAEAIYFLQYAVAQILWAISRSTLSIAIIAESVNGWITANVGYFVELLVNALSAPLGGFFILALTALGLWYALNNIFSTARWVDPSKLFTYGLIAFFFFSSPLVVIDLLEDLRQALNAGIDANLIDGAAGNIFSTTMDGTDMGLPTAIPDVNGDAVIGSFDLVAAFMAVANMDELDSSEFPVDFEAIYFPFGDPSTIDLSDEADQELAKALANDGIERLFFALVAIPTAVAEHFLRLTLTGTAMMLYAGAPIAMLFAFFIYTQAFLGMYLKQFINLLIETFMSVIIVSMMIALLVAASQEGIGLYIGASVITLVVILWRIKSAFKLAASTFDLFGGAMLTGGAGGMELVNMGKQTVMGAASLAGAALTGGATVAAGSAVLASAAALRADANRDGAYLNTDPEKSEGRVRQLKTMAGYALGRSRTIRSVIEGSHEMRTMARNFRDGEVQPHAPDLLDYMRAGSSMSGFGSSPWLAMRFSPSLRAAYDEIGGRSNINNARDTMFDAEGEPLDTTNLLGRHGGNQHGRGGSTRSIHTPSDNEINALWQEEPATSRQIAYLQQLGVALPENINRGQASTLIAQARMAQVDNAGVHRTEQGQERDVLNRFATLEQALYTLTQALTDPDALVYAKNRPNNDASNASIPEWLLEDVEPDEKADVSVSMSKDAGETVPVGLSDRIRIEPVRAERRQLIEATLAQLAEPQSMAGQTAYKTLLHYTGAENARLLQTAVAQHTATAVQQAAAATTDLVAHHQKQGMPDAELLLHFQKGQAFTDIHEAVDTPLSEAQLRAVADMVLLPQRQLTKQQLVTVIGQEVAAGAIDEQPVIDSLQMPVGFGGQTGNVRGVLAGAKAMQLSTTELSQLAEMIQDGLRDDAQLQLTRRGHRPEMVRDLVADIAALPNVLVIPQTTAVAPTQRLDDRSK